jgi:hypothetical protein
LREGAHAAGEQPKARKSGSFFAASVERLKAETDAEERDSTRDRF